MAINTCWSLVGANAYQTVASSVRKSGVQGGSSSANVASRVSRESLNGSDPMVMALSKSSLLGCGLRRAECEGAQQQHKQGQPAEKPRVPHTGESPRYSTIHVHKLKTIAFLSGL